MRLFWDLYNPLVLLGCASLIIAGTQVELEGGESNDATDQKINLTDIDMEESACHKDQHHKWRREEILRWYMRGKEKLEKELRIETLINKVNNQDIYVKEMMELNLGQMQRIKFNHRKVVGVDSETSGYDTAEEDALNADDDCEHAICHRLACIVEQ